MAKVKLEDTMVSEYISEYITVAVHEYQGQVHARDGRIGSLPNAPLGDGFLPDASQLRRHAEFILELAKTSERLKQETN